MSGKHLAGLVLAFLLLVGCQPESDNGAEIPIVIPAKPEVWTVWVSDAAANVKESFSECEEAIPGVSLLVEGGNDPATDADIMIASSAFSAEGTTAYVIGTSDLLVINHPDNPFDSLTIQDLQKIYSGEFSNWIDLSLWSSYWGEIERVSYLENSDLSLVVAQSLQIPRSGKFTIVPDPAAVVAWVSQDVNAIGIIPAWALDSTVKEVEVSDAAMNYEVAAFVAAESEEATNWLGCLAAQLNFAE